MAILKDSYKPSATLTYYSGNGTTRHITQTFLTTSSYKLTNVAFKLYKISTTSLSGTITLSLYAVDGNNKPTGSALASSTKDMKFLVSGSKPGGSIHTNSYVFTFDSPYLLSNATEYALVLSGTANMTYIGVEFAKTSAYSSGTFFVSNDSGSTWTAQSYLGVEWDCWFETYTNFDIQDSQTAGSEGSEVLVGNTWGGQTITFDSDYVLKSVEFKMARVTDTDIGAVVVSLRAADVNNKPSGEDISVAVRYSADIPLTTRDWREFTFDVPYKLVASTQYALVVHTTQASNSLSVGEITPSGYAGGSQVVSTDGGDSWTVNLTYDYLFRTYGTPVGAGQSGVSPTTDTKVSTKLWAIGADEFWYVNESNAWVVLSDSIGDIDTTESLTAQEAYGKVFIANGHNKKVADFANIKIATTAIGSHPPDFGTVLTGGSSGGVMVVDYITALASAVTIYGRRINNYPFQASEVVTGLDDDGNNISFTTSAAEVRPPHWYTWTTFGNSSNFGTMPDHASLVALYNGRVVLAGSKDYPHQWWMSRVFNPFDFLYTAGDNLTAVTSGSTEAGEVADVITALVPYGDDFFLFGGLSSLTILDGDPTYGGTLEILTDSEGIYGPKSWCKDTKSNLWFFSGDGLYRAEGGRRKPVSMSLDKLPNWNTDWEINPDKFRVLLAYDPVRNGIVISHSDFTSGTNKNYFYAIRLDGLYPETYPTDCAIFSSFSFRTKNEDEQLFLLGCNDGYVRIFAESQPDDILNDDTASTIVSYVALGVISLNKDLDIEGKLKDVTFDIARNINVTSTISADGTVTETEAEAASVDYQVYAAKDADNLLHNMKNESNQFTTGTLSISGLSNTIRPNARGRVAGIKLKNDNAGESWAVNAVIGTVTPLKRV